MSAKRDSVTMSQSHDVHHEPHHRQILPPSIPTNKHHNRYNNINCLNDNINFYVKQGSRSDVRNIKFDNINTRE